MVETFALPVLPYFTVFRYPKKERKKIRMGVLDNKRGSLQDSSVPCFRLSWEPNPSLPHILPCLEELTKELQTKRHSTQYNNKSTTVPGKCLICQSIEKSLIVSLITHRWICQAVRGYARIVLSITRGTACLCRPNILDLCFKSSSFTANLATANSINKEIACHVLLDIGSKSHAQTLVRSLCIGSNYPEEKLGCRY